MSEVQCWFAFNIIWMTIALDGYRTRECRFHRRARCRSVLRCFQFIRMHSKHFYLYDFILSEMMNNWLPGYVSSRFNAIHTTYLCMGGPIICKWYTISVHNSIKKLWNLFNHMIEWKKKTPQQQKVKQVWPNIVESREEKRRKRKKHIHISIPCWLYSSSS